MIQKLLTELDKIAAQALKAGAQPISKLVAYEAGRRIGVSQGIAQARQQIIDFYANANKNDDNL